ncbi:uncharacterized protein CDV56_104203 [Aspergillus thermomutatus]|uniref:Aminoglycoside phosphotransferase domain-containing protein n=1 Tax=Aspergillus thermomutatus TaxID=41047 RepID=A0A397HLQ5_ASPTH|nr:uncharacterized protein CDV56_104203 [Aspergillus thermomutatus]RHZ62284.1 hypothetical protein CDV56_104203 [Aspergillus thermomutatus]
MRTRMCFDDVAWEESDAIADAWVAELFKTDTLRQIGDFIVKHRKGVPTELCDPKAGAFNVSFRMKFEDGGSAIIRFPKPGASMFPEEKIRNEVSVIRYLQDHTSIPVPFILHWGTKEESPLGLGPFIIMEYIDHAMDLGAALSTPGLKIEDRPLLDPRIDSDKLEMLYGQLADILLQLSRLSFPRIGSLTQVDDFTWEVTGRPLSINMNELIRLGTLPRSKLPATPFDTASSYLKALTELHLEHLVHQRNDAADSVNDCRRKFVARQLFSPADFSYAPPWWLLLEQPEYWPGGIEAWTKAFETRLQTFLKVLIEREVAAIKQGRLKEDQRLSGPMQQSWESGDFWVTYAARKNFAFDAVFWQRLDYRFFGPSGVPEGDRWKQRIDLLDEEEKYYMEELVNRKLEEMKEKF